MQIPYGATHYDTVSKKYFMVGGDEDYDGTQFVWEDEEWRTTEWSSAFEDSLEVLD